MSRAQDGDTVAFTILLSRYTGMMIAYATRITGSRTNADDAVQEAFVTAWQKLDTIQDPHKVKSWLMRIVSHKAIDTVRGLKDHSSDQLETHIAAENTGPEQQIEINSQIETLEQLLNRLPDLQRQTWVMREIGGLSYQEIADSLELPLSTVRGAIARARQSLITGMEVWK
ncbi:RNA polymerase sigma factor [Canibacter zhoujuaniae]|uniref:RNA polymerase sigma factor n=1 Tax=Canibacter zhoujuaniae TaxID=2708343 RepID=UPI001FBA90C2|nr:RNA polymerase sigma factor [Canibacter zhoujuaniae]